MMTDKIFYEVFSDLPRQGPGDVLLTHEGFEAVTSLDKAWDVLDIGCGTGFQTLYLALSSKFNILAVDNHQPYLDELNSAAHDLNLSDRITTKCMSMDALSLPKQSFDAILSEGAAYIMGIEKALKYWKQYLKPGGHIVFSDACWIKEPESSEIVEFWKQEYPTMMHHHQMVDLIGECGYTIKKQNLLGKAGWVNNYYYPLAINVAKARNKYEGNKEALEVIESVQSEIDLFYKYSDSYSYYFFTIQRD